MDITYIFIAIVSLIIGFGIGRESGIKEGIKKGAKLQLHKEAFDSAPFPDKHDEPILQAARKELAKELRPKSDSNGTAWFIGIVILMLMVWYFFS